jgi:hypothetical protein
MKDMQPDQCNRTSITVTVLNKGFFKNEVIGRFSFQMSSIYFMEQHKQEHIWVGLENSDSDDFSQVKGMLKMSLSVRGPNDEQKTLKPQEGPETSGKLMLTSQTKQIFKQVRVRIFEARDLPLYGTFSRSVEPFLKCFYSGGKPIQTEVG